MFICQSLTDASTLKTTYIVLEWTAETAENFWRGIQRPEKRNANTDYAFAELLRTGADIRGLVGETWFRVSPKIFTYAPESQLVCAVSGEPLTNSFYEGRLAITDAETIKMSVDTWEKHGCGRMGPGVGQKFIRASNGGYFMSEGRAVTPKYNSGEELNGE